MKASERVSGSASQQVGKSAIEHGLRKWAAAVLLWMMAASGWAQGSAEANRAFDQYVAGVEARVLAHGNGVEAPVSKARPGAPEQGAGVPAAGVVVVEKLTPGEGDVPGGMLHHWRGTAFAPGATAAELRRVLADVGAYPRIYAPQVVNARPLGSPVLNGGGEHRRVTMRVKQKHVITVVLETDYDVTSGHAGTAGWSASRSTAVREIADAGTPKEHALGPGEDHGFLWRLNSYWTYEERDGGLWLRLETVSLTRAVPAGLSWAVKPFVESVPRESLEFTLRKTVEALGRRD